MWCQSLVFFAAFVTNALCLTLSSPLWLQRAPAALTSIASSASASASSSSPQEPLTHIANLRRKQEKIEQLQSEKLLAEDDVAAGDDVTGNDASVEIGSDADNEASPTLLQKKLGKIIAKIRFISRFTGGMNKYGEGVEGQADVDVSINTAVNSSEPNTTDSDQDDIDNNITTGDDSNTERIHTFQKIVYPHSKYGTPFKVSFDVNEKIVNEPSPEEGKEESQNIQMVEDMSRLGQIGVFFAEILGSIVGLLYGAAAHITSGFDGARHLE